MNKEEAKRLLINALTTGRHALFEPEAKALVSAWGIQVPKSVLVEGLEDVAIKSNEITPPLVLKVVSQDILHKREFGGVITGIKDSEEASVALRELKKRDSPHGDRADNRGLEGPAIWSCCYVRHRWHCSGTRKGCELQACPAEQGRGF
jgi:acetyltransferase